MTTRPSEHFTEEGLLGAACTDCGRRHFPAARWCPWCGAADPEGVVLSTAGTLWTWTSVGAPPPGYLGTVPFGFGVVELPADGLRIVTRLTESDPSLLELGQPMDFVVVPLGDEHTTWAFAPR
jgi:uncharacterized OB-fold protein